MRRCLLTKQKQVNLCSTKKRCYQKRWNKFTTIVAKIERRPGEEIVKIKTVHDIAVANEVSLLIFALAERETKGSVWKIMI